MKQMGIFPDATERRIRKRYGKKNDKEEKKKCGLICKVKARRAKLQKKHGKIETIGDSFSKTTFAKQKKRAAERLKKSTKKKKTYKGAGPEMFLG